MTDYSAQIAEAKKHGYSDDQIAEFLGQSDQNVKEALSAGHSASDVVSYLSDTQTTKAQPYQRQLFAGYADPEAAAFGLQAFERPEETKQQLKNIAATGVQVVPQIVGGIYGGIPGAIAGGTLGGQLSSALGLSPEESVLTSARKATVSEIAPRVIFGGGQAAWNLGRSFTPSARATQQAAQLARRAAGSELPAIQAANIAQPNVLASQAAANIPYAPEYQTMLKVGETTASNAPAQRVRDLTAAAHSDELNVLSGGSTEAERIAARKKAKEDLNALTTPIRESALETAGKTTRVMTQLEQQAAGARETAAGKVAEVRKLESLADKAEEWARDWAPGGKRQAGAPIPPTAYTYPGGELAPLARTASEKAAAESLGQGQFARISEAALENLKAKGLKPLRTDTLINGINARLKDPEIATNKKLSDALGFVSNMLKDWTAKGGIISPEALYAIRKNGVNSAIESVASDLEPEAKKALMSKVMAGLKPSIDAAIKDAGGVEWQKYLDTFAQGRANIDKQELFGKLASLYEKGVKGSEASKQSFINLVKGNNPKVVNKIFGYGNYDIQSVLGDQYPKIAQMADYLQSEINIANQAKAGVSAFNKLAAGEGGITSAVTNLLTRKIPLSGEVIKGLQGTVSTRALNVLQEAAKSGKSMNELLNTAPISVKNELAKALRGNPLMGGATNVLLNQGQQ